MEERILGIDIGVASIGWALFDAENGRPVHLVALGSRVFEPAVEGTAEDFAAGKDESPNAQRRQARQIRRQLERRQRRHVNVARALQRAGLLPAGRLDSGADRHAYFLELDKQLHQRHPRDAAGAPPMLSHVFPYWLRARALDHKLEPHELGRALYHLGQRRGFSSNRKAPQREGEELGAVKEGIAELQASIENSGARTLGEYFACTDPTAARQRIRGRWTARGMYEDEFNAIWEAQATHHPALLTPELRKRLDRAIFHQRPLKTQKHLIGKCPHEVTRPRAPMGLLDAQRFRLLQRVNDMQVIDPAFNRRPLTPEERAALLEALENQAEMKFTKVRQLLGLPKKGYRLNFEAGGENTIKGNRTAAKLRALFGEQWDAFTPEQRGQVVEDLRSFQSEQALEKRALEHYKLPPDKAAELSTLELEPGYSNLSRQALAKLIPLMEQGMPYATAVKQVYDENVVGELIPELLVRPIDAGLPDVRNPAVTRTLSELRKVVNAIIRAYGLPGKIRIELARDLKKNREQRKKIWKKNRDNQGNRESAAKKIRTELGIQHPNRDAILRVQLAEECNWQCPYTGERISMANLLGEHSRFDIEHIIPFSRCLDDSFLNKTLCYHEENRNVKRNRTPFEAYAGDEARWDQITERVKAFQGDARDAKLRRFLMQDLEELDEWATRQLNDTRYASTLAARYLGTLYGRAWRKHIEACAGQLTAQLRRAWRLNSLLGSSEKSRDDHRHHAVDAIAIALASRSLVQQVSRAAQNAEHRGKLRWWKEVPMPYDGFLEEAQAGVDAIIVSHRVSRKVNGALHEETYYSPQREDPDGKRYVHVRKRIDALSAKEVEAIVDPRVREAVKAKLDERGQPPNKAFALPENHPHLCTRSGEKVPIHKARIRKNTDVLAIGRGARQRHVLTGSNHHMEIIEVVDKKGNKKWQDVVVSTYEALRRQSRGEPVVQRDHGEGKRFVFSLTRGDVLRLDGEGDKKGLFVVRVLSKGIVAFVELTEGRKKKDIMKSGKWGQNPPNTLRKWRCQKVLITPLGEVRRAND